MNVRSIGGIVAAVVCVSVASQIRLPQQPRTEVLDGATVTMPARWKRSDKVTGGRIGFNLEGSKKESFAVLAAIPAYETDGTTLENGWPISVAAYIEETGSTIDSSIRPSLPTRTGFEYAAEGFQTKTRIGTAFANSVAIKKDNRAILLYLVANDLKKLKDAQTDLLSVVESLEFN